nr:UbiA family prenyltransferase [Streptomyces sp. AC627_RSS907]
MPGDGRPVAGGGPASGGRIRAWAELLRVPAVFTVPGDVLAGAAAAGGRPTRRTALAAGASLCLYEAGMALNDWADREEDAVARPHRPLPSGRVRPGAALAAAGALSAAGLALAACAGRRAFAVAVPLTATVWAYDLGLKHTPAGPAAMAAARSLDLLLGAAATAGTTRGALAPAAVLGSHTLAVTLVSRREAEGGSVAAPLAALAAASALTATLAGRRAGASAAAALGHRAGASATAPGAPTRALAAPGGAPAGVPAAPGVSTGAGTIVPGRPGGAPFVAVPGRRTGAAAPAVPAPAVPGAPTGASVVALLGRQAGAAFAAAAGRPTGAPAPAAPATDVVRVAPATDVVRVALAASYAVTFARPLAHAVLNPSPQLTQRAVGAGIRATIAVQSALMARAGAPGTGVLTAALAPVAARLARKVSTT